MTAANILSTANGWAKDIFGDAQDVRPKGSIILDKIGFKTGMKLGEKFSEPVWLSDEQGFTYADGTGTDYDLEDPTAAESKEAEASGTEITLVSRVSLKMLSVATSSKDSFGKFSTQLGANMTRAFKKRLEIAMRWGGAAIGQMSAVSGTSTTRDITIDQDHWAPGIWAGAKGMMLDFYDGSTLHNDVQPVIVTAVNMTTRVVSVSGEATDLTAIDGDTDAEIFFHGAKGKDGQGLSYIASNTASTYLNINASSYELWQGNVVTVSTEELTWDHIQSGIERAVEKGLQEDALVMLVPLPSWSRLNANINALRTIDAGYSIEKTKYGTKSIEFHSLNGKVSLVPDPLMKQSKAIAFPESSAYHMRVGSTDMTYNVPGRGEEMFQLVQGKNAVEMRAYSDQRLWMRTPGKCIQWNGIRNT